MALTRLPALARTALNNHTESTLTRRVGDRIEEIFALDLRSLALFRILIAAVLFGDVAFRLPHILPLYSEHGLLPTEAALEVIGRGLYFSVHFLLRGSVTALACLFAVQLLAALAMLVGYRTRIATALCWYLAASLHVAEVYHLHLGGDTYLRMMLLWGALLPLGRVWSFDARRLRASGAAPASEAGRVYSWVTFALVSQFLLFYLAAGLNKSSPMWEQGDAVYYMLHRDHLSTIFTPMLLEQRWALTPLTHSTYWLEVLGPLLFVFPFYTSVARMAAIVIFTLFHMGLAIFLDIGPYPLMSIAPLSVLLPTRFWQEWWPRLRGKAPGSDDPGHAAARIGSPALAQVFACLVVVYTLLYQVADARGTTLPRALVAAGSVLRLNQNYKMMQDIGTRNFWLIVDGYTADGSRVDPFQRHPVSMEKPDDIPGTFRSFRWRQFLLGSIAHVATNERGLTLHHAFAEYLCREWNAEHSGAERLERLQTVRGYETTYLDHVDPPEYAVLWQHECGASRERDAASLSDHVMQLRAGRSEP